MKRNVRGSVLNWKFSTKTGMADALYPGGLDKRDNQDTSARSLSETVQGINDVTDMFLYVAAHRVSASPKARIAGLTVEDVLRNILKKVDCPGIN